MADFDELRSQLREARARIGTTDDTLFSLREQIRRIEERQAHLDRIAPRDSQDEQVRAERARLEREKRAFDADAERLRAARPGQASIEARLRDAFKVFADPRQAITHFGDRTPILMMPLRLETRFKELPGNDGALVHQLWVRIYPDDCWIDSFDPMLTTAEVENTRAYWISLWQAGGIEAQERSAWRALVGSHGSGRAAWLVEQYQPANLASKPAKPRAEDLVLTIASDASAALGTAEAAAASAFWRAAWLADGDAAAVTAARNALVTAVGAARAEVIIKDYAPLNFATRPPAAAARDSLNVLVAFALFPAMPDTKRSAWSRAPKMTILPDRFLFIGYHGADAPLMQLGEPVPPTLFVAPDPSAGETEQIRQTDEGDLHIPDELEWLSGFDRAVTDGMGFRITLSSEQARSGFDRVLVVGLRPSADEKAGQQELEGLLRNHAHSRKGLGLIPQGTATNNTDANGSGFDRLDDPDESFDHRQAPLFVPTADWGEKRDGQWLAEWLGVDPALFQHVPNAGMTDQLAGRAMNTVLWPTTLGYWMESMMTPVFDRSAVEDTRRFFNRHVLGAGAAPAIRIGAQPYGILPATAISRMRWFEPRRGPGGKPAVGAPFLARLYQLLTAIDRDWRTHVPSTSLSHVGSDAQPGSDPHRTLLDIVGLHPGSVQWWQRYAESFEALFNRLKLQGFGGFIRMMIATAEREAARQKVTDLGYTGADDPPILSKSFSAAQHLLKGGTADDKPLSEEAPVRAYAKDGKRNYLQWLLDAARTSLEALYEQKDFAGDKPPTALLYLLMRNALQLGYHDVSIRLYENAGLFNPVQAIEARRDAPFLHVKQAAEHSESRYQQLVSVQPRITGSADRTVASYITAGLDTLAFTSYLREQLAALEWLKDLPTARLERAFGDHIDTCSYRLDAWLQGLVTYQLAAMRNVEEESESPARQGVYLGAYAWLEHLRPKHKQLTPTPLPAELEGDFNRPGDPALMTDSTNEGYVHAPSLNQAVAAAILRNGFISNADETRRDAMAVNLTSERVRTALGLLEGIRAGQGLADLLGYQFERGLHDRHGLAEVDKFIYKLRRAFPLRADRMNSTRPPEGVSIESIEARNVIDGLAFAEHLKPLKASGTLTYPFGLTGLPGPASQAEKLALEAEADRLLDAHDAVADLALAEGVYQAVLGNYDRVASTYDAYARGHFPPTPEVVRTPLAGVGLTSRVALHLDAAADPSVSPVPGLAMTPRARGEPAINAWLAKALPPLQQIGCVVSFREAASGATQEREITLHDLQLQSADVVNLVRDDARQAMTEIDDRIVRHAMTNFAPRPDVAVSIEYMKKQSAAFSVFELMPLLRALRTLVTASRPLSATDLSLASEAREAHDAAPSLDSARLSSIRTDLQTLRADLALFVAALEAPLSDLPNRRDEILDGVDDYVAAIATLLARAASFAVAQSGWGFAYDFQRRAYQSIKDAAAGRAAGWNDRLSEYAALLQQEQDLPATATDEERFQLLAQAERKISTIGTQPLPPNPAQFRTILETVKKPAFLAKRQQFADIANSLRPKVALLRTDVLALLPIEDFDASAFSLLAQEDEIVRFAEDVVRIAKTVIGDIDRRLAQSAAHLNSADATAVAAGRVAALEQAAHALLGDDFRILPRFTLDATRGAEFEHAVSVGQGGELLEHLTHPDPLDPTKQPLDFPVDTWLHGVARVRDKMHALEQLVLMAGAFGKQEPGLEALQLPVIPGDGWFGLELKPGQKVDSARLMYTAHFAAPFNKSVPQCGMLLDEWTETIPGTAVDTGITLHTDRPNPEAPQAMLLVTPTEFRGAWQWDDLVDALNETLDFAKRRAVEPGHLDSLPYAALLPATVMASQVRELTIAANLALNNSVILQTQG